VATLQAAAAHAKLMFENATLAANKNAAYMQQQQAKAAAARAANANNITNNAPSQQQHQARLLAGAGAGKAPSSPVLFVEEQQHLELLAGVSSSFLNQVVASVAAEMVTAVETAHANQTAATSAKDAKEVWLEGHSRYGPFANAQASAGLPVTSRYRFGVKWSGLHGKWQVAITFPTYASAAAATPAAAVTSEPEVEGETAAGGGEGAELTSEAETTDTSAVSVPAPSKSKVLGYFDNEDDAARCYDQAAAVHPGLELNDAPPLPGSPAKKKGAGRNFGKAEYLPDAVASPTSPSPLHKYPPYSVVLPLSRHTGLGLNIAQYETVPKVVAVASFRRTDPRVASAAEIHGAIKPGDQLLAVNGADVRRRTPSQIARIMAALMDRPGVNFIFLRFARGVIADNPVSSSSFSSSSASSIPPTVNIVSGASREQFPEQRARQAWLAWKAGGWAAARKASIASAGSVSSGAAVAASGAVFTVTLPVSVDGLGIHVVFSHELQSELQKNKSNGGKKKLHFAGQSSSSCSVVSGFKRLDAPPPPASSFLPLTTTTPSSLWKAVVARTAAEDAKANGLAAVAAAAAGNSAGAGDPRSLLLCAEASGVVKVGDLFLAVDETDVCGLPPTELAKVISSRLTLKRQTSQLQQEQLQQKQLQQKQLQQKQLQQNQLKQQLQQQLQEAHEQSSSSSSSSAKATTVLITLSFFRPSLAPAATMAELALWSRHEEQPAQTHLKTSQDSLQHLNNPKRNSVSGTDAAVKKPPRKKRTRKADFGGGEGGGDDDVDDGSWGVPFSAANGVAFAFTFKRRKVPNFDFLTAQCKAELEIPDFTPKKPPTAYQRFLTLKSKEAAVAAAANGGDGGGKKSPKPKKKGGRKSKKEDTDKKEGPEDAGGDSAETGEGADPGKQSSTSALSPSFLFSKNMSVAWKALSAEETAPFEDAEAAEKAAFEFDTKQYLAKQIVPKLALIAEHEFEHRSGECALVLSKRSKKQCEGLTVAKVFPGHPGKFNGQVLKCRDSKGAGTLFKVKYEDGDEEELTLFELAPLALPEPATVKIVESQLLQLQQQHPAAATTATAVVASSTAPALPLVSQPPIPPPDAAAPSSSSSSSSVASPLMTTEAIMAEAAVFDALLAEKAAVEAAEAEKAVAAAVEATSAAAATISVQQTNA